MNALQDYLVQNVCLYGRHLTDNASPRELPRGSDYQIENNGIALYNYRESLISLFFACFVQREEQWLRF